jgi:hypothetical protein
MEKQTCLHKGRQESVGWQGQAEEGRQRLTERSRRLEACKQMQAGIQAHKAGWQKRRQECIWAKTSKEAEPGRQTNRLEQTRYGI